MTAKVRDFRYKLNRPSGPISKVEPDSGWWWRTGYVSTPFGIVGIYSQEDYSALVVMRDGYLHERTVRGPTPTERGLRIMAGRFARDVFGKRKP